MHWPRMMEITVDVVPILGTSRMGAARIAMPRRPPRYRYHYDSPGKFLKLAVDGKQTIRRIKLAVLTNVSKSTASRLPAR